MSHENVIEIRGLSHAFGAKLVLTNVNLTVQAGQTFAFLGRNGQGKTTTIRTLMGLLKPNSGQVRVLGLDPTRQPLEVRRRVGFLAEDQAMYGWMTVAETVRFIASFYPTWDTALAQKLAVQFELPMKTRVRSLSKGQNVRLGLLLALAHHPRLVILDDPTLGLDSVMRRQFLSDVVALLQSQGVTVFFSSHLLYEVEPIADQVAILRDGKIVLCERSDELRERVKKLIIPADQYRKVFETGAVLSAEPVDRRLAVTVCDYPTVHQMLLKSGVHGQVVDLNLDEIFHAYVMGEKKITPPDSRDEPEPAAMGKVG